MITAVMTAAPRQESTLVRSLLSLERAGIKPKVYAEPHTPLPDSVEVHQNKITLGIFGNWKYSALRALFDAAYKRHDYILTLQDDIEVHQGLLDLITHIHLNSTRRPGVISLYTAAKHTPSSPGIQEVHTDDFWGACALLWPRDILAEVLDCNTIREWNGLKYGVNHVDKVMQRRRKSYPRMISNVDSAINHALQEVRRPLYVVHPSPVQHIAQYSTKGHGDNTGDRNCSEFAVDYLPLLEQVFPDERRNHSPNNNTGVRVTS